jgi:hypothetical protein
MGDLDGALEAHRSGLAIGEYLAGLDVSNSEWQRDLGQQPDRRHPARQGDATAAAAEYRAGFVAAERLLDADPGNVQRILDVATAATSSPPPASTAAPTWSPRAMRWPRSRRKAACRRPSKAG